MLIVQLFIKSKPPPPRRRKRRAMKQTIAKEGLGKAAIGDCDKAAKEEVKDEVSVVTGEAGAAGDGDVIEENSCTTLAGFPEAKVPEKYTMNELRKIEILKGLLRGLMIEYPDKKPCALVKMVLLDQHERFSVEMAKAALTVVVGNPHERCLQPELYINSRTTLFHSMFDLSAIEPDKDLPLEVSSNDKTHVKAGDKTLSKTRDMTLVKMAKTKPEDTSKPKTGDTWEQNEMRSRSTSDTKLIDEKTSQVLSELEATSKTSNKYALNYCCTSILVSVNPNLVSENSGGFIHLWCWQPC